MRRCGLLNVLGKRGEQTDDVAEAFLFIGLGHADDGAEGMGLGIVTGVCRKGREDDGHAAQAPSGFHVAAEIVAGALEALAFDFGDEQRRSEEIEDFAGFGGVADGDYVVAFIFQIHLEGFAELCVRVHGEDHRLFRRAFDGFSRGWRRVDIVVCGLLRGFQCGGDDLRQARRRR